MSPELVIANSDGLHQTVPLNGGPSWNIGRERSGGIVLRDGAASRLHAIIQRSETGEHYLIDAGSRNGTFLRGRRLCTPVLLKHGDEISIGSHRLFFHHPVSTKDHEIPAGATEGQFMETPAVFAQQLVTVLVVDIQGFTKLTQQIEQDLLCRFIRRWFADGSKIFREHGSWALKYIGDALMTVWLHKPGRDQSFQIWSALEAVTEFAEISNSARYSLPVPLGFCAGFNTGMASVGNAGSSDQADFTAFGDVVNAAFRVEASTRRIGSDVAVGDQTVALLGGPGSVVQHLREHTIDMKGYDQPMRVWAGSFANVRELCDSYRLRR